jgi:hypothetical protein
MNPLWNFMVQWGRISTFNLRLNPDLDQDFTPQWLMRHGFTHYISRTISVRLFNHLYRKYSGGISSLEQLGNIKQYAMNLVQTRPIGRWVIDSTCEVVQQALFFTRERSSQGTPVAPTVPTFWMT